MGSIIMVVWYLEEEGRRLVDVGFHVFLEDDGCAGAIEEGFIGAFFFG